VERGEAKKVDVGVCLLKDNWEGEVRWRSPELEMARDQTQVVSLE